MNIKYKLLILCLSIWQAGLAQSKSLNKKITLNAWCTSLTTQYGDTLTSTYHFYQDSLVQTLKSRIRTESNTIKYKLFKYRNDLDMYKYKTKNGCFRKKDFIYILVLPKDSIMVIPTKENLKLTPELRKNSQGIILEKCLR